MAHTFTKQQQERERSTTARAALRVVSEHDAHPRLRKARRRATIGGQTLFDEPWHCSFCGMPYIRRSIHGVWDEIKRGTETFWRFSWIKVCVTRPQTKDKEAEVGCSELNLTRLLKGLVKRS